MVFQNDFIILQLVFSSSPIYSAYRGKPSGHDIDVLLHHSNDDYETDFLQTLTEKLQRKVCSY